jgi:tetratricopeptide (TPR) repeat protein
VSEQGDRPGQRPSAGRPSGGRPSGGRPAGNRPARSDGAQRPDRAVGGKRPGRSDSARRPEPADGAKRPDRVQRSERRAEPPLPEDVSGNELDRAVRAELASLASMNADIVARHLVMAGRLLDEDPDTAYLHATAAAQRAGRVGVVREAAGLAAYRSGHYAEALSELRAARRITGDNSFLPVMADCERGLGRPERAIEMAATPDVARLDAASRVELLIVVSGARRDMGQPDAAVLALQGIDLLPSHRKAWSARLFYAYADALTEAGRAEEAFTWFGHAAAADTDGETDADVRIAELSGVTFLEADDGAEDD